MKPHENVVGVSRSDYLLSLDEEAIKHRDVIIQLMNNLVRACLVGNPAPIVQEMADALIKPKVGDLVVEASVVYRHRVDMRIHGFGYLLARRRELVDVEEETGEEFYDDAWYVQYGQAPIDICRWTNCNFYTVLAEAVEMRI